MLKKKIFICLSILLLTGCANFNFAGLKNLSRLAKNQEETEKYVLRQEKLFYKLKVDVQDNKLKKGMAQDEILSKYGEPIFYKAVEDKPAVKESLLYRLPTEYFSSDKVYLYFDSNNNLYSWELQLAAED